MLWRKKRNMADESLNDPGGKWVDDLTTAARDFVFDHMDTFTSMSQDARDWLANPDFETVLGTYFDAGGFSVDEWERMAVNIENIRISEWGNGIWVSFDFDFESEDGQYEGSRGVAGGF
jgi:hypothetical protein